MHVKELLNDLSKYKTVCTRKHIENTSGENELSNS